MADEYSFTDQQREMLEELLKPDYDDIFLSLIGNYQPDGMPIGPVDISDIQGTLPDDLDPLRESIVLTAYQLLGKVTYFWGGKSLVLGWDSRWGTPTTVTAPGSGSTGKVLPFGLDCSGFVDWTFYNATSGAYLPGRGGGAASQHGYCTNIAWSDALPGDLVFYADDSHVGIVCGYDSVGQSPRHPLLRRAEWRGRDRARGLCRRSQTGFVYGLVQFASFVRHSLLALVNSFLSFFLRYLAYQIERRLQWKQEKNLCAMLPVTLHTRVRQEQEKAGMTLGEYVEAMITEYYDWKDGKIMTGEMRTLAAQIPAELFDRLDRYLKERGIKKKDFLVDIITRALEEAEAAEVTETITETPPNDDGEAILHDEPDEQPEADEI